MTGRAVAIQGGLAAVGLLAAHLTWQREPEKGPGEVNVIDVGKKDLAKVHYEDDKLAIDLSRQGDQVWVHLIDKFVPKVDPNAKPPAPAPEPIPPRDLKGSEAAEKLLGQFAPFRSPRGFGVLDATKLKELGLEGATKKLDVTAKGDTRQYVIGQPYGTPSGESFVRDTKDGKVYLMPRGLLPDLQAAQTRLVDRRLHSFQTNEFDRLTVSAGSKKKEYVQVGREKGPSGATMALAASPDKPDQMAKNWHDTLWRTFPMEILGKDEIPKEGTPKVVARIEYFDGKKSIGWVELGRVETAGGESAAHGSSGDVLARSEFTAGWIRLHTNAQLLADTEKMATGGN